MGQTRDGGYMKLPTTTEGQQSLLNQVISGLGGAEGLGTQGMEALKGYLPGGEAFSPIEAQARKGFQEQTIPQIMEALGSGAKGSSAINQAIASAGAGLEGQLAAQRAQTGLQAISQINPYLQMAMEPQFAYTPRQKPFWQEATLAGIEGVGHLVGSWLGNR